MLAGVRLVSPHADDQWIATATGSPEAVLETVDDAAVWIRQRLKSGTGSSKYLPILCLDTDGAICTWIKPEDSNPDIIAAAIDQLDEGHDDDDFDGTNLSSMGERFPNLPLEVSYQTLSDHQTSEGSRSAVLATPDIPARLLIDQLDSMGIRIGRVESIWTLIAQSWDPGAPHRSNARDSQRVISTDDPVCSSIVLDPDRSRLLWTWSKCGHLIAAGSMRIQIGADGPTMHQDDLARLCADWLGWAAQLGVAPLRVLVVMPENAEGLDRAQIGSTIASHWPTATTDLIIQDDPILATLRGVHGLDAIESNASLTQSSLTNRPGRSHKAMYRWASGALILASVAIGLSAWTLFSQGSETKNQAKKIRSQWVEKVMGLQPPVSNVNMATLELQDRVNLLVSRTGPMKVAPSKPILEELETLSFVVGIPGIEIESIQFTSTSVKLVARTDGISMAEQISEALRSIDGSYIQWRPSPDLTNRGNLIVATYTGLWKMGDSS